MRSKIIQIGNSVGVRLPKALVQQYDLKDNIELLPTDEGILIRPAKGIPPRSEWDAILSKMDIVPEEGVEDWDITLNDGLDDKGAIQ